MTRRLYAMRNVPDSARDGRGEEAPFTNRS